MPYNTLTDDSPPPMRRLVFPRGYRPQVAHVCVNCATVALRTVPAAHASPVDATRFNYAYACDLRYDGCQHRDGLKR